jgi:hypothetical protein
MNFDDMYQFGSQHWPFFAFAVVAMLFNQVIKSSVFTKKRAHEKGRVQWLFWWGWKTLPLHPVTVGFITGSIWRNPEGTEWPLIASMFYFALAGTLSVWLYQIIKGIAKKKGYDLGQLPGQTPVHHGADSKTPKQIESKPTVYKETWNLKDNE